MTPNVESIIKKYPYLGSFLSSAQGYGVLEQISKEFAIEILKYNLKQYRTQMLQFNTGESGKFKSFDEITLETIKELENENI